MADTAPTPGSLTILDPWPFAIVPDSDRAAVWAGRTEDRDRLRALVAGWRRRRASEIDVIWADFGQGKTHSLMHLHYLCEESLESAVVHYVQLPPLTTGSPFVALYKQLLADFPLDLIAKRVFEAFRTDPNALNRDSSASRHVLQLLWLIGTRSPGADVARRWLQGDRVGSGAFAGVTIAGRTVSMPSSPTSPQDCQNVLDILIGLITDFPPGRNGQFVLLIDEFQRLGELTPRKRVEVCNALHLVFNQHPQGLRLVLAFAGGMPEIVSSVLTQDLLNRELTRMALPPLTHAEGQRYVKELLAAYRNDQPDADSNLRDTWPFTAEAVDFLLRKAAVPGIGLSPRRINIAFDRAANAVLDSRLALGVEAATPIGLDEVESAWTANREGITAQLRAETDDAE